MEKYCTAGQVTDDKMAHAHCKLDNQDYKRNLRICNTVLPQKQWLLERASKLRCKYIDCLISLNYTYISCLV